MRGKLGLLFERKAVESIAGRRDLQLKNFAIREEIHHEKQQRSDLDHTHRQPAALEGALGNAGQTRAAQAL
jgi:hypothetical protein